MSAGRTRPAVPGAPCRGGAPHAAPAWASVRVPGPPWPPARPVRGPPPARPGGTGPEGDSRPVGRSAGSPRGHSVRSPGPPGTGLPAIGRAGGVAGERAAGRRRGAARRPAGRRGGRAASPTPSGATQSPARPPGGRAPHVDVGRAREERVGAGAPVPRGGGPAFLPVGVAPFGGMSRGTPPGGRLRRVNSPTVSAGYLNSASIHRTTSGVTGSAMSANSWCLSRKPLT